MGAGCGDVWKHETACPAWSFNGQKGVLSWMRGVPGIAADDKVKKVTVTGRPVFPEALGRMPHFGDEGSTAGKTKPERGRLGYVPAL